MKVLAKAKIKDLQPKREFATAKTKVYRGVNRERKPIWDGQKVGTGLMGAVALGGLATYAVVSAMEGQPIDMGVAAVATTATTMGTAIGGGLGYMARDTKANNKGHRLVQAYYEMKEAKHQATLKAIKDVASGEVAPKDVLSSREMVKYENIHGKQEVNDTVTLVFDNKQDVVNQDVAQDVSVQDTQNNAPEVVLDVDDFAPEA